jgi:hypothetical protein
MKASTAKRRLESLRKEGNVVKGLMKDLQAGFFEREDIGRREYRQEMGDLEKRIAEILREQTRLVSSRPGLLGFGRRGNTGDELRRLKELAEETQHKYFESGAISKAAYREAMRELNIERAEIEKGLKKKLDKNSRAPAACIILAMLLLTAFAGGVRAIGTGSRADALAAIDSGVSDINEMQMLGFGISRANDTLNEAMLLFSQGSYAGAESLARYVGAIKEKAVSADGLVDEAEAGIYETGTLGADVSSARELFEKGLEELRKERFEEAETLLKQSLEKLEEAKAGLAMQKAMQAAEQGNIAGFLRENWLFLAGLLALASAVVLGIYKATKAGRKRGKIKSLREEKGNIEEIIKKMQKAYFEEGTMSKSEYLLRLAEHQKRSGRIKKELLLLTKRQGHA